VQKETTALGAPCLTVRENNERSITIGPGTNTLVGTSPDALVAAAEDIPENGGKKAVFRRCGTVSPPNASPRTSAASAFD
jgi:UDP-N-acetylglucosamine 2-epimerase